MIWLILRRVESDEGEGRNRTISRSGNVLWNEKIQDNREKRLYSEMWENTVRVGRVKIIWSSPCATVLSKLSLSKGRSLLRGKVVWDRFAYCQLSSWNNRFGLYWCMPGTKRKRDYGVNQLLVICLVEGMRWKCGDGGTRSCWWSVVVGW